VGNVARDTGSGLRSGGSGAIREREPMTIAETRPEDVATEVAAVPAEPSRVAGWLITADHTRIGRMYVGVSLFAAIGVLVVGTLVMAERIDTRSTLLPADNIAQLTSFVWIGLAFLVVVPLLLGIAIAVVPLQLGANAIAYPRAAALSFWGWLFSSVVLVASYLGNGGPGGGDTQAIEVFLTALVVLLVALVVGAACVAGTVITRRAPGMGLLQVPPFSVASLVSATALLLTLPVLAGRLVLLYVDQRYGRLVFGGTDGIAAQIEWAWLQPQTYVYGIPILGLAAEILPVAGGQRQPMRSVVVAGLGVAGAAAVGGMLQGMPVLDLDSVTPIVALARLVLYGVTALLPVLPFLIVLAIGGLAIKGGRPRLTAPLLFALAATLMGLVGALVGVLTPINDLDLVGTVYQESQSSYLFFAGLLAGLGAIAYWGPKLWGRRLPELASSGIAALGLIGTVLAAFPYVIAGFLNQPIGAVTWPHLDGPITLCNVAVTIGFGLLALSVVSFGLLALRAFTRGEVAGDDPWDGQTLEWAIPSPPDGTIADLGPVTSAEPLLDARAAGGEG
jgi:heme/copper-type cytochrome/quinol oxidase subunit 1